MYKILKNGVTGTNYAWISVNCWCDLEIKWNSVELLSWLSVSLAQLWSQLQLILGLCAQAPECKCWFSLSVLILFQHLRTTEKKQQQVRRLQNLCNLRIEQFQVWNVQRQKNSIIVCVFNEPVLVLPCIWRPPWNCWNARHYLESSKAAAKLWCAEPVFSLPAVVLFSHLPSAVRYHLLCSVCGVVDVRRLGGELVFCPPQSQRSISSDSGKMRLPVGTVVVKHAPCLTNTLETPTYLWKIGFLHLCPQL